MLLGIHATCEAVRPFLQDAAKCSSWPVIELIFHPVEQSGFLQGEIDLFLGLDLCLGQLSRMHSVFGSWEPLLLQFYPFMADREGGSRSPSIHK
ncbi:MAG: hypothetical protein P0120_18190 [Nitrospira sp.]|nr:hypothetical protein [Nitrospira sp.]